MTEDEAKKKWCPYATVVAFNYQQTMLAAAISRTRGLGEQPMCLASGCMAWVSEGTHSGHCGFVDSKK